MIEFSHHDKNIWWLSYSSIHTWGGKKDKIREKNKWYKNEEDITYT